MEATLSKLRKRRVLNNSLLHIEPDVIELFQ